MTRGPLRPRAHTSLSRLDATRLELVQMVTPLATAAAGGVARRGQMVWTVVLIAQLISIQTAVVDVDSPR